MPQLWAFRLRYRPAVRWITTSLIILAGATAGAQDFGPIPTRNHRALSLPFLRFEPRPNLLGSGERLWEAAWTSANDFRFLSEGSRSVAEDYEVQRLAILYRQGLKNGLEWSIELPWMSRGGGFQDPIIDWWHANVLHWSDPQRDSTRFGRSVVQVPGSSFSGSADGIGDISMYLAKSLAKGVVGSVGLKLPTGNAENLLGSGAFDVGAYVQAQVPIARKLRLHAQLGLVAQGRATELDDSRSLVHQEGFALVWQPNTRDAWIAQWQGEASATETGVSGSDATHRLITIGYKRKLSARQQIDLFFSEDRDVFNGKFPEGANVGPDFTVGIRFGLKF